MKPKFEIGDMVEVEFSGDIEGVSVKVRKKLFVTGINLRRSGPQDDRPAFKYNLQENWFKQYVADGKTYTGYDEQFLLPCDKLDGECRKLNQK